jgi:hypothetical protein
MNTLFVAMQAQESRRWAPVARLRREHGQYRFVYTRGCRQVPEFEAFGRLDDLSAEYVSDELFPLFANRVLPKVRPEYQRYMNWLGLNPVEVDVLEELGRTGGLRATDGLELISCPEPTDDRRYEIRFFARGVRHLGTDAQAAIGQLQVGERLFLVRDVQNEADGLALMLRTGDPVQLVGYVPRYYSADLGRLLDMVGPKEVAVYVDGVNNDAPLQYRLRCRLTAPWPEGFAACEAPEFQPISTSSARRMTAANGSKHQARPRETAA